MTSMIEVARKADDPVGGLNTNGALGRHLARRLRSAGQSIVNRWYENQFAPELLERYEVAGVSGLSRLDASTFFVEPLLELLLAFLETGESRYRDVYLDERLRYAPHKADPLIRRAFFREIVPADEHALLDVASVPEETEWLRAWLDVLHGPLYEVGDKDTIKLLAVGDCLLNEVRVFLRPRAASGGLSLDMRCAYFSASVGKHLSSAEVEAMMTETRFDVIAFSFFTYEGLPPYTALLREADGLSQAQIRGRIDPLMRMVDDYLSRIREKTDAPFLLHNVSGLPLTRYRRRIPLLPLHSRNRRMVIEEMNDGLRQIVDNMPNILLLDESEIGGRFGLRNASGDAIPRGLAKQRAFFHTSRFGEPLADAYMDVLTSFRDLRRTKVLLVDFDNTLWDGVMADGPVVQRTDEQKLLRRLKDSGILLVALSKNDPNNVRWDEMVLQPEDFAALKINWNLKAQSIQEVAVELDLGVDSFVVLDDSVQERALIAERYPTVRSLDSMRPETWKSLERMLRFPNTRETEESRGRTELYRAQAARRRAQGEAEELDYEAMMASLGLRIRFRKAVSKDLDRLTELAQRTNQFNTTTIRYTKRELSSLMGSDSNDIYTAEVIDKFGSFGLVALVVVSREEGPMITFESFVMSCRAMGYGLEQALLRLILDGEQASSARGLFVPTDRNAPSARLFADNGFSQRDENSWILDDLSRAPNVPAWIAMERR